MTKAQRNILVVMGGVFVCCLLPLLGVLVYWLFGPQITPSRPLVVIHRPASGEQVQVGRAVAVHSTARDDKKVARIELWADGQLQSSQTSPRAGGVNPMTLIQGWQAETPGFHTLVVRAFNRSGGSGQASAVVEVVAGVTPTPTPTLEPGETPTPEPTLPPGCEEPVAAYLAQEGDTLASIAPEMGATVEQLQACNPELGTDPLAAGTVVLVPAREEEEVPTEVPTEAPTEVPTEAPTEVPTEAPTEAAPPGGGGPPPAEGDPPPMDLGDILDILGGLLGGGGPPEPEMEQLEFDALILEASDEYIGVWCYGELASFDPQRIPTDGDLPPAAGERRWDMGAQHWAFPWPPDQPLRVSAECEGRVDAWSPTVRLGEFESFHGPDEWDGRRLVARSTGGEGGTWFEMEYRINYAGEAGGVIPPPTNLLQEDVGPAHRLRWDWAGDESTIDGFRIYLNDSLQWAVTNPGARSTGLPEAWINPPCGETYRFHVTAFRGPLGAGVESISSDPVILEGPLCEHVWRVTFDQIQFDCVTADIGLFPPFCPGAAPGDSAGPIYGHFGANGEFIDFDSEYPPLSLLTGWMITPGPLYAVQDVFFGACFDCPTDNSLVVPVGPGEDLTVGADIFDRDPPPGDPGAMSEWICLDAAPPIEFAALTDGLDGEITCATAWGGGRVHYVINAAVPGAGGGMGGGAGVGPALPDLTIIQTGTDADGRLLVRVQNAGTVPVASWDLAVRLERASSGENLGTFIFPGFTLDPGGAMNLTRPDWVLGDPADIVVTLDPDNALPETNKDNNIYSGSDLLYLPLVIFWWPAPPAHERTIEVNYQYHSDHGDEIQVRVTPLYQGAPVADLHPVSVTIPHGDDMAPVHVTYTGAERAYTDQLLLEMVDMSTNTAFHTSTYNIRYVWLP